MSHPLRLFWCVLLVWNIFDFSRDHGWQLALDFVVSVFILWNITTEDKQ